MSDQKHSQRQSLLISAGLLLLVLIAFEPVRHNGFVDYDDNQYLIDNPHIQSGLTRDSVKWALTSGYASNWHPLTWLSHAADIACFGMNPLGHHLHNVALHALATVLLFSVLKNLTGAVWRSAFVAMAFGIHPLRVESVAWVSERKDVLCAVFWMLTMAAWLRYVKRGGAWRYLLVLLCFALGLMTKPMLVTLPVILLALDFWPLERMRMLAGGNDENRERKGSPSPRPSPIRLEREPISNALKCAANSEKTRFTNSLAHRMGVGRGEGSSCMSAAGQTTPVRLKRLVAEKIPLLALALASSIITFLVQDHGHSVAVDLSMALRISNALTSYIAYLKNILWPVHFGALLYPYPTEWPLWKPIAAALTLIAATALVVRRANRQPYLAVGWFWFVMTLAPVIGIIQVGSQSMADRYSYLPSIGIFIMLAWLSAEVSARWPRRQVVLAAASGLCALGMVVQTRTQTLYWRDSITLFEHALAITTDNYHMHFNLGWTLARQNRTDEAIEQFNRALALWPDYPDANLDLADTLIKRGQFDDALLHLDRVLKTEPRNALAHYDRGVVFQSQKKPDEAIDAYEQAVRLDPNNSGALNNLGILRTDKGQLYDAADCFQRSLRVNANKAETHRNFAVVLQMQNRTDEALAHYRAALKINPNNPETSWDLAYALHASGNLAEAADYDNYTLRLHADHVRALNDLAWILATTTDTQIRNPSRAIELAQRASELTESKEADIQDTLATAYASAGRFKEAIGAAQKAIVIASATGQNDLVQDIGKRLQLFQSSSPYVEVPLAPPGIR